VDVTDGRVVEEGLEASETVEPIEHREGDGRFGLFVERIMAGGVGVAGEPAQLVGEELAGQSALVVRGQAPPPGLLVRRVGVGERLTDGAVKPCDEAGIRWFGAEALPGSSVVVIASSLRGHRRVRAVRRSCR
jgi:hypothetical protein